MDLIKLLNGVNNLNDYIELTQDLENKHKNDKIVCNMSAILCLKKIRSLEIEYFNKCDGSGAAFILFERMLNSPPSKTWALLGSELTNLVQYWLEAVRKHLISHNIHWWHFLKHILGFIKEICQKDSALSNMLVEETAECMLDLATSGKPDTGQRYEILHTFNIICAESSREIRLALRTRFEHYFIRLSAIMSGCGQLPLQAAALETLLRWLQPRHCPAARRDAAAKWLPPHLYPAPAKQVFLERRWQNFYQDARDFLNCHNEAGELVTSVLCRKMTVGDVVIVPGSGRLPSWLDVNAGGGSASVLLEPPQLEALGAADAASCETLAIYNHNTKLVKLHRESSEVTISISTLSPPCILPSALQPFKAADCDVRIVVSSHSNLARLDGALRTVFQGTYQLSLDVNNVPLSPTRPGTRSRKTSLDGKSRFSHPVKPNKSRQAGFMIKSRRPQCFRSPSTASTTSLAQLHDKLEGLPYYEFNKEPVSVCAHPELSIVNELNESENTTSLESTSTIKLGRCGVQYFQGYTKGRKTQSDGETVKTPQLVQTNTRQQDFFRNNKGSQSDNENARGNNKSEGISSLYLATIGSADETIIDATLERLPKDKALNTDRLMELLVQEALQAKEDKEKLKDSGINTGDGKKTQEQETQGSEIIEGTQFTGLKSVADKIKKNCAVSKSTSDESNTEAVINDTPACYITVRKRNQRKKSLPKNEPDKPLSKKTDAVTHDIQAVEEFFSQHVSENQVGDLIISPTLAKKINETSSESSEDYLMNLDNEFNLNNDDIPDLDIVECLNSIVDKVCLDFDKCSEYLNKVNADTGIEESSEIVSKIPSENTAAVDTSLRDVANLMDKAKTTATKKPAKKGKAKAKPVIKLKFPNKNQKGKAKGKGKLLIEPVSKMSTILEDNNESDANKQSSSDEKENKEKIVPDVKTPEDPKLKLVRRKRKLYSPNSDEMNLDEPKTEITSKPKTPVYSAISDDEDIVLANLKKDKPTTPKSVATCYKDLEKARQKHRLRTRKDKNKESPSSPKTAKINQVFDHLKDNIENNEQITIVDKTSNKDIGIFNFTSDSEDEDFKQKKIELQKRTSTTTVGSSTSMMSIRGRGRNRKKTKAVEDGKESSNDNADKPKRKRVTKRNTSKAKDQDIKVDLPKDLVNERMREAPPEVMNTSFVAGIIEDANDANLKDPELIVNAPELEVIPDEIPNVEVETVNENIVNVETVPINNKQEEKPNIDAKKIKMETRKTRRRPVKKQDNIKPLEIIRDDDRTVSPLPELVIETVEPRNDCEESLTTNLIEKLQKAHKDPDAYNDTITTQNMISENDKPNHSPQINITEELGLMPNDDSYDRGNVSRKSKLEEKISTSDVNTIDDTLRSEHTTPKKNKTDVSKTKTKRHKLQLKERRTSSVASNSVKSVAVRKNNNKNKNTLKDLPDKENSQMSNKTTKSQIEDLDAIISLDTQRVTRSRSAKSNSKSREMETINISGNSDKDSGKSIATDGITAHGDPDELPPSPELLKEKLSPRELTDMDQGIREYYIQLSREVNTSKDSNKSKAKSPIKEKTLRKEAISSATSPDRGSDKSIQKKQFDYDLSKWLPSAKETESECSSQASQKVKSPSVSITRLTNEDIARWLPTAKSSAESQASQKGKSPSVSITGLTNEDIARCLSTAKSSAESSVASQQKEIQKVKKTPNTSKNRKSQISPIKFDDFLSKRRTVKKDTSKSKEDTFESIESLAKMESGPKRYFLRPTHESSPISRTQQSEESTPKSSKRKSPTPEPVTVKKRKIVTKYETVDISSSRQSSNVDDWLKKLSASYKADYFDASTDTVQNLMEKLDTTLAEIHQNTTKDFISLFVGAQKQLTELAEERRRKYRETAVTLLTNVTQLIDQQFSEMDRRAEERESQFMSWLKSRASDVLRRDCRQKRAMVMLLRQDAQAAAAHLAQSQASD